MPKAMRPPTRSAPFARGVPLAPAPWVDVTFGAGSVASTADDMIRFMRSLADAAQGRGGLGLSPAAGEAFTSHAVPSDTPGMTYGNGLMHVGERRPLLPPSHRRDGQLLLVLPHRRSERRRRVRQLHLSAFAEYRPRLLTRFAVDALTNALAGQPLADAAATRLRLPAPATYVGHYCGSGRQVRGPRGSAADHRRRRPVGAAPAVGRRDLPHAPIPVPAVHADVRADEGRHHAARAGARRPISRRVRAGTLAPSNPALAKLAGRYVNDNPWYGTAIVVERGGKLWIGTETPMTQIGDNLWRVGEESWSPERASFAEFHRRPPADASSSRARSSFGTTSDALGLAAAGRAAKGPRHGRSGSSRITPDIVAEHGLAPDEYDRILKALGPRAEPASSSASSRSCGRSIAATRARAFT